MAKEIEKTTKTSTKPSPALDVGSRLKRQLLERMLGRDDAKPVPPGPAHVLLVIANHGDSPRWPQWKARVRGMFEAAGGGLREKLGFYGADDEQGVRRCRISSNWIDNADSMDGHMDRAQAQCACGCFVFVHKMLQRAAEMNAEQPMRAVIIDGDAFHDDQEDLDLAAIAINQLRREGTRVFLVQQSDRPDTARRLQYLARVADAAYFKFGEQEQQQYADLLHLVSAYATGGEAAVQAKGGQTATLLLEHLQRERMPILEPRLEPVTVERK
jgi:hypothetical protein